MNHRTTVGLDSVQPSGPSDDPANWQIEALDALVANLRAEWDQWHTPVGADGVPSVLDPGYGRNVPAVPLRKRIDAVRAATGLPVALLDTDDVPRRISTITALVNGEPHYTGTEARYAHLDVTLRLPFHPAPPTTEDTAQAAADSGLFDRGTLVVDGARVTATLLRHRPGEPVITRMAAVGGWLVGVRGEAQDSTAVQLVGMSPIPGPGRPNPTLAA